MRYTKGRREGNLGGKTPQRKESKSIQCKYPKIVRLSPIHFKPPPPLPSNMKPKLTTLLEQYNLTSSTHPQPPIKELFTTSNEGKKVGGKVGRSYL